MVRELRDLCEQYGIDIEFSKLYIKISKYKDDKVFRQIYSYEEMDYTGLKLYDLVNLFLEKYYLEINKINGGK